MKNTEISTKKLLSSIEHKKAFLQKRTVTSMYSIIITERYDTPKHIRITSFQYMKKKNEKTNNHQNTNCFFEQNRSHFAIFFQQYVVRFHNFVNVVFFKVWSCNAFIAITFVVNTCFLLFFFCSFILPILLISRKIHKKLVMDFIAIAPHRSFNTLLDLLYEKKKLENSFFL